MEAQADWPLRKKGVYDGYRYWSNEGETMTENMTIEDKARLWSLTIQMNNLSMINTLRAGDDLTDEHKKTMDIEVSVAVGMISQMAKLLPEHDIRYVHEMLQSRLIDVNPDIPADVVRGIRQLDVMIGAYRALTNVVNEVEVKALEPLPRYAEEQSAAEGVDQ